MRTIIHWNNLCRDVVWSSSLEVFKLWSDRVLNNLIWAPSPMEGWARWFYKAPSNLGCSMILYLPLLKKTHQTSFTKCFGKGDWFHLNVEQVLLLMGREGPVFPHLLPATSVCPFFVLATTDRLTNQKLEFVPSFLGRFSLSQAWELDSLTLWTRHEQSEPVDSSLQFAVKQMVGIFRRDKSSVICLWLLWTHSHKRGRHWWVLSSAPTTEAAKCDHGQDLQWMCCTHK